MESHIQLIQLIVAFTLTGGFVFTVIITCLSMIGLVKFSQPTQQQKLFAALIVELVVLCVGFFAGLLKFNPVKIKDTIVNEQKAENASQLTSVGAQVLRIADQTHDKVASHQLQMLNDDIKDRTSEMSPSGKSLEDEASDAVQQMFTVFEQSRITDVEGADTSLPLSRARNGLTEIASALIEQRPQYFANLKSGKMPEHPAKHMDLKNLPSTIKPVFITGLRKGLQGSMKQLGDVYAANVCDSPGQSAEFIKSLERGTTITISSLHLLLTEVGASDLELKRGSGN